jgi:hypothetical protein
MRKFLAVTMFALCFGSTFVYAGSHNFQAGKLLDVTTDVRANGSNARTIAILSVQIGDIVYTLNGGRVSQHANDYAKGLIVGDPVQASVEGGNVILPRPDGKDMKTSILKRERIQLK